MQFDQAQERRIGKRRRVVWACRMTQGRVTYAGVLYDVSVGGARLKFDRKLLLKTEPVLIWSPKFGELRGEIVYQRNNVVGVRFLGPRDAVDMLLKRAMPSLGRRPIVKH